MQQRPNPNELLIKITQQEVRQKRGRLKIFFGACAGVGKTFAMLSAARALQNQSVDVLVGFIETHGRKETAALLEGLAILPPKLVEYRGRNLHEFDLDTALLRKPAVILIDELAHTNLPSSRHNKRWQDVEELLNAGIDVYTTVNVQHLESLTDIVSHITGIKIGETFPDRIFNNADEVKLVDLPPDELLVRLQEGKVYFPQQIKYAIKNFFRKGNLIALRELALRRMADRVDVQMREYRDEESIHRVWQTKDRILVCVGPEESSRNIIRKSFRFATSLRADWFAVYVETPKLQKLSKNKRDQILKNLKLAQELGAETSVLAGTDLPEILIQYARVHNINKIIVGKPKRSTFRRFLYPTLAEALMNQQTDIDIYIVERTPESVLEAQQLTAPEGLQFDVAPKKGLAIRYLWGLVAPGLVTVLSLLLTHFISLSDIAMLYLLGVTINATRLGRGPSLLASLVSVLLFDFCFVPPQWSFLIANSQYLITFLVLLIVAIVITSLTANLRYQARIAIRREQRTNDVIALSKELITAVTIQQITEISIRHLSQVFQAKFSLLLPDENNKLQQPIFQSDQTSLQNDLTIAQWVFDNGQPAGAGTQTLAATSILYLPLRAQTGVRGVLAIFPINLAYLALPEQQRLLDIFTNQIALSLEHLHYIRLARDSLLAMESERLRDALLSAIAQAFYPPVSNLLQLSKIMMKHRPLDHSGFELALALHQRTANLQDLISNLRDITRLQIGDMELNRKWCDLSKIIHRAIKRVQTFLANHQVVLNIPKDLPLVHFDPILMKRVFCHLLENAGEYTPPRSVITISVELINNILQVFIEDNGPGLPQGMEEKIFEKFIRGKAGYTVPGVGLGLAISRAILEAHGCEIKAENRPEGGAKFIILIPLKY